MPLIDLLNAFLMQVFGWLLLPFRSLAPIWGLTFISLVTGLLMLWIFGLVSNQEAIRKVKDRIRGNLLAVRLYQHDVAVVLKSQARIFRDTFVYMKYSLIPMLVLIVPVILIIIQLHLYFAVRPVLLGESVILKVELRDPSVLKNKVNLVTPPAVQVETPPVRIPLESEVDWRIHAEEEGTHTLRVLAGDQEISKELVVGEQWWAVNVRRTGKSWWDLLLYPGEKSIPASCPVEAIEVTYQPLPLSLFGWNVNWLVYFFVASIVFGFAFKGFFDIEV